MEGEEEFSVDAALAVRSPASVTSGGAAAELALQWDEDSQVRLLRQYRTTAEVFAGTDTEMWNDIFQKLRSAGMKLKTARSAKDKLTEMIKAFKASNRLDEWKSGDPGTFTEKEQLQLFKEHEGKRRKKQSVKRVLEDEKQSRKDKKMMDATTFCKRKRRFNGARELTPDPLDGGKSDEEVTNTPKRERTSYNHMISTFLDGSSDVKMKELQLKQEQLEVERGRESRLAEEYKMKYDLELNEVRMGADNQKDESNRKRDELMAAVMMEALKGLKKD
ncbi:hypothetical protein RvY_01045 [Ramazzottius varieornatus]|uniref:Uncharacterized protein n=1 Tax=Ramazzottius varieornatus TaxID=947166 RepID=A0A1D1UEW7_RAMVA|nr:hypothetical protein RvY_01045 [Ramazzottius varieornatus]